jgi:hypothetical protein
MGTLKFLGWAFGAFDAAGSGFSVVIHGWDEGKTSLFSNYVVASDHNVN